MRTRSRMRLIFPMLAALILALASMTAVFAVGQSSDADRSAVQAQPVSDDDGHGDHCEESDSNGHKDCEPENNPNPEDPPCDADHGHPAENSPECQDRDGDGVPDHRDECPDEPGTAENDGCPEEEACPDRDDDGVCDDDDLCPDEPGTAENDGCPEEEAVTAGACTAEAGDPGLPLTEDTLGQTIYDEGAHQLSPLTEDPEANGELSGPIHEGGNDTEVEPLTDEVACALDLLIDEGESPLDP